MLGELIVSLNHDKPDFEAVIRRFMSSKEMSTVSFIAFEVIQHEGKSVTNIPLVERKELLEDIIPIDTSLFAKTQFIEGAW